MLVQLKPVLSLALSFLLIVNGMLSPSAKGQDKSTSAKGLQPSSRSFDLPREVPFTLPSVFEPRFKSDTFNILNYGAIPDGVTLNTSFLAAAIKACHQQGGGVVLVPSGQFLTGPVELLSNVNLHLDRNAMLLFTTDFDQYPLVETNWEGLRAVRNQSPIFANRAENIAITGYGIIDGQGSAWRMVKKDKQTASQWKNLQASGGVLNQAGNTWYPSEKSLKGSLVDGAGVLKEGRTMADMEAIKDFLRPNLMVLTQCKNILLEGVTFQNSAAWCLHPLMSEHITIRNILVKNPWYAQNGDGLDLESCKNVVVENSVFDVGDDGICIKSGRDEQGRARNMPTENVYIKNCTVYQAHGGFVIGSEMSGGAKNIFVSDCHFNGTDIGLRFKTTRGRGGIVENIFIQNIHMAQIVGEAILFDMYYMAKDPIPLAGEKREAPKTEWKTVDETTPQFRKFLIRNVVCNGAEKAIFIRGLPEMAIRNIELQDMVLSAKHGMEIIEAENIRFQNIQLKAKDKDPVVQLTNSRQIVFQEVALESNVVTAYRVGGDRTRSIQLIEGAGKQGTAPNKIKFEFGAKETELKIIPAKLNGTNRGSTSSGMPFAMQSPSVTDFGAWSERLAQTAMNIWPDSFALRKDRPAAWSYDLGVILKGMEVVWKNTGKGEYFNYIRKMMDGYLLPGGQIKGYRPQDFNIDFINNGKLMLTLYQVTRQDKYAKAAKLLRTQLLTHPRIEEGGFWHKKIYTHQMWLDGLYMGQPFYAQYAEIFKESSIFDDVTRQFVIMEKNARDPKTGLLYHGYDESRTQQWADKKTGTSPHFWGRSLGWFGMALVDALDYFPSKHPGRDSLIYILDRFAQAIVKYQHPSNGLWYQVTDRATAPGNYPEASASSMITYTLAKGVRKGYLSAQYYAPAVKGFEGIVKHFIKGNEMQGYALSGTVSVAGLGGNPYRDGSYEYYLSERVIDNDPKGLGAFIKCAAELEYGKTAVQKKQKSKDAPPVVLLDHYFNREMRNGPDGKPESWHYTWNDQTNGGFSLWGELFQKNGASIELLETAPTAANLKPAKVYIIVDPDTPKETELPNYLQKQQIRDLIKWVKKGGTLVLMANDSANAEFLHFNQLARKFGFSFREDSHNPVLNNQYQQGAVPTPNDHPVFPSLQLYIKEYASIQHSKKIPAFLAQEEKTVMVLVQKGRGRVLGIGDPWLYNEYVDGRKLPAGFQNYEAAEALTSWLLNHSGTSN